MWKGDIKIMSRAEKFIELLEDGKIKKHILPNNAPDYTQSQEKKDIEAYRFFVNSFAFDKVKERGGIKYNGDEQV